MFEPQPELGERPIQIGCPVERVRLPPTLGPSEPWCHSHVWHSSSTKSIQSALAPKAMSKPAPLRATPTRRTPAHSRA